ncbi:hypothetical protein L208DRAFT_1377470 [Tricholoma matsutake]|nr:hypothetical protein L208DRAFT_1377470 [Tricholoma matsutake 945]
MLCHPFPLMLPLSLLYSFLVLLPSISSFLSSVHHSEFSISASTSLLCKFCDQPIPSIQSAELTAMRKCLEDVTWPEESPDNLNHHEAQSFTELLPEAEREGWPKYINFDKLHSHILSHQEVIELIMIEPAESEFFELAKKAYLLKQKGKNTNTFTEQSAGYQVFGTLMHPLEDENMVVEDLVWEQAQRHRSMARKAGTPVKVEQPDVSMAWKVNREVINLTLDDD